MTEDIQDTLDTLIGIIKNPDPDREDLVEFDAYRTDLGHLLDDAEAALADRVGEQSGN